MRHAILTACAGLAAGLAGCLPAGVVASPLGSAFHPPAVLIAMSATNPLVCRIEAEEALGLVRLTGVVRGHEDVAGRASMRVRRAGLAGISDNSQATGFRVRAGEEATVGQVAVSVGGGDDLAAELTVEWDGGRTACRYP